MSISSRKAGATVTCPQCVHRTVVPLLGEPTAAEEIINEEESSPTTARVAKSGPFTFQQEEQQNWKQHSDPWNSEEEETEDFKITGAGLQESGLDMTPMVDVTFLLLIFFMITASLSLQKSLETTPPDSDDSGASQSMVLQEVEEASVIVEIDADNLIRVDDVLVSGMEELLDVLAAKVASENKTEMLIEADPAATHGTVVAVMDAGIEVQMQRIRRASRSQK